MSGYGWVAVRSEWFANGIVGAVEQSATGNVILRVGHELARPQQEPQGWTQTEHVVLTQDEARALAADLLAQCGVQS